MIGDSASNADALIILILGTILAASLSAIWGFKTMDRAINEVLGPDPDEIPDCSCGDSWCQYVPNKAQKAWWRP